MAQNEQGSQRLISKYSDLIIVSVIFAVLTVIFTWPLASVFTTFANGNIQDIFHEIWFMRLGSTAPYGPFFLFFTNTILYPTGVPLYFQVSSPINTLLFALLSPAVGEIAAYNFLYMLTFFLSALFMYIFAFYLTNNKYGAFVAAIIFGFAPIHLSQGLGHLNIMSAEFVPLFGYFLMKLVRETTGRTLTSIGLALAVVLNAMCDLHMLLMVITITVAFLIYYFLFESKIILNWSFMSRFVLAYIIAAFFTFIVYFQTVYGLLFAKQAEVAATAPFNSRYSADLLSFFVPPPSNPIIGHYAASVYSHFLSNDLGIVYIGWTALALSIVGVFAYRRNRQVLFWLFVALVGFLISLGPYVVVNGNITPIPGVWQWFYFLVPLFKSFRTPYRFAYTIMLGVAVLAAYGVTWIATEIQRREKSILSASILKTGLALILVALIVIEFITIPFPTTNLTIPQGYQILARDHSNYNVLEVPVNATISEYFYYQQVYNRPLINGHVSRTPQYSLSFAQTTPFINQLGARFPGKAPPDIVNQSSVTAQAIAPYILGQYNIKYIIVHKNLLTAAHYTSIYALVSSVTGAPIYQDNLMTIFEYNVTRTSGGMMQFLDSDPHIDNYSLLYGGWYQYGRFCGPQFSVTQACSGTRAMEETAGLDVFSKTNDTATFHFVAEGVTGNYSIVLYVNGVAMGTYFVSSSHYGIYYTNPFPLVAGENNIEFYSPSGCSGIPTPNKDNIPVPGIPCVSIRVSTMGLG
jgi:hypothetical protein